MFGIFLNAESAEAAGLLAEHLFNEDNIEIMKDLAKATNEATISVEDLTRSIIVWNTIFKTLAPGYDALNKAMEPYREEIEWMRDNIPRVTFQVSAFNTEIGLIPTNLEGVDLSSLGLEMVTSIKNGFIDALKDIDWEEIIKDIIEEHFD